MHKPCLGRDRAIEFNVTPMIDVVFLLVIFFLVSSHLASQETQVALELPTAKSNAEDHGEGRVTINVMPDGSLRRGANSATIEQISEELASLPSDELQVRIRADRRAEYGVVEPLLLACANANIWDVSFVVIAEVAVIADD